jgi:hypothetical protein
MLSSTSFTSDLGPNLGGISPTTVDQFTIPYYSVQSLAQNLDNYLPVWCLGTNAASIDEAPSNSMSSFNPCRPAGYIPFNCHYSWLYPHVNTAGYIPLSIQLAISPCQYSWLYPLVNTAGYIPMSIQLAISSCQYSWLYHLVIIAGYIPLSIHVQLQADDQPARATGADIRAELIDQLQINANFLY